MPKSRDSSPAKQEDLAAGTETEEEARAVPSPVQPPEATTQPSQAARPTSPIALQFLEVPSAIAPPTQTSRPRSPARLSSELQIRARVQEERLDTITSIVENLKIAVAKEPLDMLRSELVIVRDTLMQLHLMFQQEHKAFNLLWPVTQLDHDYYKSKKASTEEQVAMTARMLIAQLEHRLDLAERTTQTTQHSRTSQSPTRRSRLPEVPLPTFAGDYSKWGEFKSAFTTLIMERSELSDLDRLHYLKGAVIDDAAQLISQLPNTSESFPRAWKLLDDRFDNKRLNAQSYMDRLYALKPMKTRKAASLIKMTNIINETTEAMKGFGLHDPHNCYLLTSLTRLLDTDTRERWQDSLQRQKEYPTLEQFTEFLLSRASTLQQLELEPEAPSTKTSKPTPLRITQPSQQRSLVPKALSHVAAAPVKVLPTPSGLTTTAAPSRPRQVSQYPCAFCEKEHYVSMCPLYRQLSIKERVDVVRAHALCINCLGHHNLRSCRTTQRCKLCNEQHHSLLHGGDLCQVVVPGHRPPAQPASSPPQSSSSATQTMTDAVSPR